MRCAQSLRLPWRVGLITTFWTASLHLQAASLIVTNWVAYNDHRPGPAPTATTWGTATNVSVYDMRVGPGGNLTNFVNGEMLSAAMAIEPTGNPDDFGTCVEPNPNTPAYTIFFGKVDVANNNSVIGVRYSQNTLVTLTFNGLNPDKHYLLRGTGIRGGSYPLRWTVATITGADTFVDAHSSGVLTSNDFPAALTAGQAAWNSGDNRAGEVVGWDFISPGQDGSFSVISSNYVGPIRGGGNAASDTYGYALSSLMLAEVEIAPPAIVSHPRSTTTVEQNRSFELSVEAAGIPLLYQWYKEGSGPITGATFSAFSVARAALSDGGSYYVVVYNPLGSVTSSVAQVTVNADVQPPSVATVFSYPSFDFNTQQARMDQVILEFSEPVEAITAGDPVNYTISGDITPASVILTNETTVFLQYAEPLAENTPYVLQVRNVRDLVGNPVGAGSTNNPAPFQTWTRGPGNGLLMEVFESGTGVEVALLTNSSVFPNSPSFVTNLWGFDTRIAFADDAKDNYGTRVRGVFIPPITGDWLFFLRTYDRGELYLNPNGTDAEGKIPLVAETTGNDPRDWNKLISSPVHLRAGQAYYIEGLQKAGTGTDFIKAAARLAGTGLPVLGVPGSAVDSNIIAGAAMAGPFAPRDLGGPLTIIRDLEDATVEEKHPVTLAVEITNPSGLPIHYQWRRNGVDIPGVNMRAYTFSPTMEDDGAVFSVQASKIGTAIDSREARLTVVPDTILPRVISVRTLFPLNKVQVSFSEKVDPIVALDSVNYHFADASIGIMPDLVMDATGTNVIITLDTSLAPDTTYPLYIESIWDLSNNMMDAQEVAVASWVKSRGFALQQLYLDIGAGATVNDLITHPKYPNLADRVEHVSSLEGPTSAYDSYGTRLSGWIAPPVSGDYTLYVSTDDQGQLSLSQDDNPANLAIAAVENSYSSPRTWTGPGDNNDRGEPPGNVTAKTMAAGQLYAFELLAKENSGTDSCGAAWQAPGGMTPTNGAPPIPGAYLYALADPVGASVTITQQPANAVVSSFPATVTFTVGAASTYIGAPNTRLSYLWQRDTGVGFQDIFGAYSSSIEVPLSAADMNARFRALVFSPGASTTSAVATVTTDLGAQLAIQMANGQVRISWPAALTDYVLDQTPTLANPDAAWTLVPTGTYQTEGDTRFLTVPTPTGTMFYRLRRQ